MFRAAIDIGSNSILLTVVDEDGAIVHDEARVVGLGRGLGEHGVLSPDRMRAAHTVLEDYAGIARKHGIEPWAIRAVATSAARRAMNAQTWLERIHRDLGIRALIISGEDEARLSWRGAQGGLDLPEGPTLVIDLGGGSTELVIGEDETLHQRTSLELGSVRLTEAYLKHDPPHGAELSEMDTWIRTQITRFAFRPSPSSVVGVAGTTTTLATYVLGLETYDARVVHGSHLTRSQLSAFVDTFRSLDTLERRARVPASPERADYLLAGAMILGGVLDACSHDHLIVSDRGVRFGLLTY